MTRSRTSAQVCPPDHNHRSACYDKHGCRCLNCRVRNSQVQQTRRAAQADGTYIPMWVDPKPARQHVRKLMKNGLGWRRIAELANVSGSSVTTLIWGTRGTPTKQLSRINADKLLALDIRTSHLARGVQRRLQALCALGWSLKRLAELEGYAKQNIYQIMKSKRPTRETVARINRLYDRLSMTPPSANGWRERSEIERARRFATDHGWAPPLAWDDIDTDPFPRTGERGSHRGLDMVAVEHALTGAKQALNKEEREEAIRILRGRNFTDSRIGVTLHLPTETVHRIRKRLGLAGVPQAVWVNDRKQVA